MHYIHSLMFFSMTGLLFLERNTQRALMGRNISNSLLRVHLPHLLYFTCAVEMLHYVLFCTVMQEKQALGPPFMAFFPFVPSSKVLWNI